MPHIQTNIRRDFFVKHRLAADSGSARASRAGDGAPAIVDLRNSSARRQKQHARARALPRRRQRIATYSVRKPLTGLSSGHFSYFRAAVGWQRQELLILVSARLQT